MLEINFPSSFTPFNPFPQRDCNCEVAFRDCSLDEVAKAWLAYLTTSAAVQNYSVDNTSIATISWFGGFVTEVENELSCC